MEALPLVTMWSNLDVVRIFEIDQTHAKVYEIDLSYFNIQERKRNQTLKKQRIEWFPGTGGLW